MGFNKKFFTTGGIVASTPSAAAFDPLQNFETVTYTGNGGTQKITGYIRKGAAFNGSSSKIDFTDLGDESNIVTVSFWLNTTSSSSYSSIFTAGVTGSYSWMRITLQSGKIVASLDNNIGGGLNGSNVITQSTYNDGSWYHIACVFTGTYGVNQTPIIYVNGSVATTVSNGGTYTSGLISPINGLAALGYYRPQSTSYLDGKIDQVRIFNKALSSSEVTTLYGETYASSTKSTTDIFGDNSGVALYELDDSANDTGGTYNGTATNVNFLGMAFQPDLVWIKNRETDYHHRLIDSVRGLSTDGLLYSNLPNAADDLPTANDTFTSFDSNGFTLGSGIGLNQASYDYVAWCWKAGGPDVLNENGSINSQVSANPDAGFSIVKYTGNGSSGQNIGHGLSSAPEFIIIKNTTTAQNWLVYNTVTNLGDSSLDYGFLSLNYAFNHFGNSGLSYPTSTVFNVGTSNFDNSNNDVFIAYCFHSVDGYQKVGSYTGTGASGNTITTGFRPRFLLIKNASSAGNNWNIMDSVRDTANPIEQNLWADTNDTESTASQSGIYDVDFDDNGFTLKNNYYPFNFNGETYIYLAIA